MLTGSSGVLLLNYWLSFGDRADICRVRFATVGHSSCQKCHHQGKLNRQQGLRTGCLAPFIKGQQASHKTQTLLFFV